MLILRNSSYWLKYLILIYSILLLVGCQKQEDSKNLAIEQLEHMIVKTQKNMAKFPYSDYEKLLTVLSDNKFVVLPLYKYKDSLNAYKVVVGLRHDVDNDPFKALEIAKIENRFAMRSTFFMLATAPYYGYFEDTSNIRRYTCMNKIYKEFHKLGSEIGIHNNLISIMIEHKKDPFIFNREEIAYYNSLGIPIFGTSAHGSYITEVIQPIAENYEIFSDFAKKYEVSFKGKSYKIGLRTLNEFGFLYEAYFIYKDKYFSDSGGAWNNVDSFEGLIRELKKSKPGERIIIMTHPEWWGKKQ
jgi:hypothetical protein